MSIEIVPFETEMVADAAVLLAQQHKTIRQQTPQFPSKFEDPAWSRVAIEALLNRHKEMAWAAMENNRLVAYMIAYPLIDGLWGRTAWVRAAGCALATDQSHDVIYRLYARLGEQWVNDGIFAHYAVVPVANAKLMETWFYLGFGVQETESIMALQEIDLKSLQVPESVEIRRADSSNTQDIASLADLIWRQHILAPTWGVQMPETVEQNRADWAEMVDDPTVSVWLAYVDNQVVGSVGVYPSEPSGDNILIPDKSLRFTMAVTREEFRGRGIATALSRHAFAHGWADGFRYMDTDWRGANLPAVKAWNKQGFRATSNRLVRLVDTRIAWAKGNL